MKRGCASQSAPARRSLWTHRSPATAGRRPVGEGGFFNLRVLIGLFIVLTGIFLMLAGFGAFSALTASMAQAQQKHKIITNSKDPLVPNGFDCSKIHQLGIDMQENMRAGLIMIACGAAQGGSTPHTGAFSKLVQNLLPSPLNNGGTDVDVVLPDSVYPHVTQSETYTLANPDNTNQVFIAYNDSRTASACYAGGSYSTDGGATFSPLIPQPFCSGHGTNFGDPVALYNKPTGTWFAIFLASGCGGTGIGAWTSSTPWNPASWTAGPCIHNGSNDDRESGWSDNNPASPFYGRMYVSWNDFARGQGLFVRYSTDNGATWPNERQLAPGTPFIRNVQITGDLATGDVYVAGMNEGGGGLANRNNLVYRSTDGGNSWTNTYTGPAFPGPGRAVNGYFACMYPSPSPGYWTYMGWGQIAAYNHVVHYDYGQCGGANPCSSAADHGNVFYIRSTDSGVTFDAPFQLNTDTGTAAQWESNLSVSPSGTVFATWYDERDGGTCTAGVNTPCYRMYSRKSNDNGVTWQPDAPLSDVVSPLPAQVDPSVRSSYAGDYDYGTAIATKHLTSWDDGRVIINGFQQQDVFTDREIVGIPCTPGWSAGPNMPSPTIRAVGVYFQADGNFYSVGGRSDPCQLVCYHVFRYSPSLNTWTQMGVTLPDDQVNNMACGVLTLGGVPYIYCVGGSASGAATATARVFYYNPITDTVTTLPSGDNWPGNASGTILPGGSAVVNNKLYILGGFNINVASTNQIWQFDPTAAVGSKWTQMTNTPEGIMYAPTAAIGGIIYVAGASDFSGGTVIDTTNSFSFNPATNTIGTIAPIPRATGETRAVPINGVCLNRNRPVMAVLGGGRVAPNPSSEVDIYDPATNTWSTCPPFMTARRNFPTDTDGISHIWLAGGYAPTMPTDSMEVFCAAGPTATPTATPTCTPGGFRVLIAYADTPTGPPTTLQSEILAEPGVVACDLFSADKGTPTLQQLERYNIVFAFSNYAWNDATGMGNVLADYEDAGGVVVVGTFAWDSRGPWLLAGRWVTGGYSPYNSTSTTNFSNNTASITDPGHPLMQGVSSLSGFWRNAVTLATGASSVAVWTDGPPAVAYKANNGHTAVGLNAYMGGMSQFSGDWGRVIVNAGRWLLVPCGTPTPTPTATQTATHTPTPTPTATFTPTATPRPTPTPRPNPTPRGRPTPPPRP